MIAPEDDQRDDVQQRLRDHRAEHDRQVLARSAGPARDHQRARRLAEAGRQRRGHQHADERALHRVGQPDPRLRQRGLQDRVPGERAHHHRAAHDAEPEQARARARGDQRVGDVGDADLLQRQAGQHQRRRARRRRASRRAAASATRRRCAPGQRAARGSAAAARGTRGLQVGGARARSRTATRCDRAGGRRRRDRVLVGLHHLGGDPRPGEALARRGRRPGAIAAPALRLVVQVAQRLGERLRVARAAPARRRRRRGRRRGSRRCRRRRPACRRRTPRSAPCRSSRRPSDGAHSTSACSSSRRLVSSSTLPSTRTPRVSSISGASSSQRRADHGQLGRDVLAQRLEGAQQQRQALALDRLADEHDPQLVRPAAGARRQRALAGRRARRWGSPGSGRRRSAAPVHAAASETAIRTCRRLSTRRAPSTLAIPFGSRFVE